MPQPFRVPDDLAAHGLEFLPDGLVAAIGQDATVRFMNSHAERITGLCTADVVGRDIREALPVPGPRRRRRGGRSTNPWEGLVTRTGHRERLLMLPSGREVLVTAKYVRGGAGEPVRAVVLGLRDAEGRRRAEAESAALLTTVAHELRSPLTGVKGFSLDPAAQLGPLHRRPEAPHARDDRGGCRPGDPPHHRAARRLPDQRRPAHGARPAPGPAAPARGAGRAPGRRRRRPRAVRRRRARRPPARCGPTPTASSRSSPTSSRTPCGTGRARCASPRSARSLGDRPAVDLLVADDGEGIATQHRELVFSRFWQGGAKHGTGLGLYLVRGLVEAHGGVIRVEDAPGGGAQMRATFPDGD